MSSSTDSTTIELLGTSAFLRDARVNEADFPALLGPKRNTSSNIERNHDFLVAFRDGKAVGAVMLFMPAQANNIHMESMEVPSPEVNGDVFNKLMEKVFELGAQQNKTITSNGFSQDGARHVGKVIDRMVAEHGSPSFASIHQV